MPDRFGEYIVYVDESGDHGLRHIDRNSPYFVLAFCIFEKTNYLREIVPAIQSLKFEFFGHDMVILHESDIRKSRGPFSLLLNAGVRRRFFDALNSCVGGAQFKIVASCIDKRGFLERRGDGENPYHVAMEFGLERVFLELQSNRQVGMKNPVIFECRGKREDAALELEFRRILDQTRMEGMASTLDIVLANKQVNSAGLQLADMVARPIARHLHRPDQPNRAFEILSQKFRRSPGGEIEGWGLKCYP